MELHVVSYLVVSAIMLFAGIYGFFTRKNLLAVLISVELMLRRRLDRACCFWWKVLQS